MPRVPEGRRRVFGTLVPAPSEQATVAAGVSEFARQAQSVVAEFALERAQARRGHQLAQQLSGFSQDLEQLRRDQLTLDPQGSRERFQAGAQEKFKERLEGIDDRFVRDNFQTRGTRLTSAMSIAVGDDEFKRERVALQTQLREDILPKFAASIVEAGENDVLRESLFRDATAAVEASSVLSPEQKEDELRLFEVMIDGAQGLRWLREDPERLLEMADDPSILSNLDPDTRERLITAGDAKVERQKREQAGVVRLELYDRIEAAVTGNQLESARAELDRLVEQGVIRDGLTFARQIDRRRDAIVGEIQSVAIVEQSLRTGRALDRTDPDVKEAVDFYWNTVSALVDPETQEKMLGAIVHRTGVVPPSVLSDLRGAAGTNDPEVVAQAATTYEVIRQANPATAAAQMKEPEFLLLAQMHDSLVANEPPAQAHERLLRIRAQPEGVRNLRRERLRDLRSSQTGETDLDYLDDNAGQLKLEVPGWFNSLNPEGGFPPEFEDRFSLLVEQIYVETDDLPFARKKALEIMGATWGVTGVGANKGLIVPLAPERIYDLTPEQIEAELVEDLRGARIGLDGPPVAALLGEGLVEVTEEASRATLDRIRLAVDLQSGRRQDEQGEIAPDYPTYILDEEGFAEMLYTEEGLPFRFSPTRPVPEPVDPLAAQRRHEMIMHGLFLAEEALGLPGEAISAIPDLPSTGVSRPGVSGVSETLRRSGVRLPLHDPESFVRQVGRRGLPATSSEQVRRRLMESGLVPEEAGE